MKTVILNILCEGQTEEKFVKDVLKPYLKDRNIIAKTRLLCTSRKENKKGGLVSYQQAKADLEKWQKENLRKSNDSEIHYYTTMFDFYALPKDFPGFAEAKDMTDAYQKVELVEKQMLDDTQFKNFIPYIQLYEFESLLFSDIKKLINEYPNCKKEIENLNTILTKEFQDNPELINHSVRTAPSKRIIDAIENKKKYNYNKPKSGASITKAIGIVKILERCKHFRQWVDQLVKLNPTFE